MPFTINYEPISSNGQLRAMVTARQDGRTVWNDTINLSSAQARERFTREVCDRAGVPRSDVDTALLSMVDRQSQQGEVRGGIQDAPNDPHRLAGVCLQGRWRTDEGDLRLAHYRDQFHEWNGVMYEPLGDKELRSYVAEEMRAEFDRLAAVGTGDGAHHKYKVTRALVADVVQALASIVQVSDGLDQPCWLDADEGPFPADQMLAMPGGLVDVVAYAAGDTYYHPPTSSFFTANGLDYDLDPMADCPQWLTFLNQIWPDDPQSIQLLQEYTGYLLLPDTSQQKILLLHGPKRSGRGTMMRVIRQLVGTSNVVGPTLKSLQNDFGLEPLLGKLVAIINDARLSGRHDLAAIVETLLSISGEDTITVNRKGRSMVTTALPARIVIVTNELPNLRDSSGALASRLLILRLTQSWYGQENRNLTNDLLGELPGILTWAIQGLRRLKDRGHFVQPQSARPLITEMERLSSPILAFISDYCERDAAAETSRQVVYAAWCNWCEANHLKPGTQAQFGRDLRSAVPELGDSQPNRDGHRLRCYCGIRLRGSRALPCAAGAQPVTSCEA